MKRAVWATVAVIVVIGAVGLWQPWEAATAQEDRTIDVRVAADIGSEHQGVECFPFGLVEVDGPRPFRQLIITNAVGAVIGAIDLDVGTVDDGDCVIAATVTTIDTAFYTFTVDGKYRHTISSEALGDHGWRYDVWLGIHI